MEWGWMIAVATFLAGQVAVIGVEWARHWMQRDQRRRDAREDFQRQTLRDLQEALYQFYRALANSVREYQERAAGRTPPQWPDLENPRIISAGVVGRIVVLTERVEDADVRDLIDEYITNHEELLSAPNDTEIKVIDSQVKDLRVLHGRVNKRIGEVLRRL